MILGKWWAGKTLAEVTGQTCRAYAASRSTEQAARRELEDLRAAINHHRKEGLCHQIVGVWLPPKAQARERWLTRSEAAALIWSAYRYREVQKGKETDRRTRRHVARFILVALYTGTRSSAVCGAALRPTVGRGYVDLERGVFYRRAQGARETKKRQPPVRLPDRLLAHLRRWERQGIAKGSVVEFNGEPVKSVKKAFGRAAADAGLDGVTPHILRHTAATWGMQNRGDPWELAGLLGMSVEVLLRVYGHHHPDHQADAASAVTARPVRKLSENSVNGNALRGRDLPEKRVIPIKSRQK